MHHDLADGEVLAVALRDATDAHVDELGRPARGRRDRGTRDAAAVPGAEDPVRRDQRAGAQERAERDLGNRRILARTGVPAADDGGRRRGGRAQQGDGGNGHGKNPAESAHGCCNAAAAPKLAYVTCVTHRSRPPGAGYIADMPAGLPPGPRLPRTLQTLGWWTRTIPFLERCRARYGKRFTLRLLQSPAVRAPRRSRRGRARCSPRRPRCCTRARGRRCSSRSSARTR